MSRYNIAQVNIGRILAELDDPVMAGFVNRLDEINVPHDASPGFVWRLIVEDGNATYLRPFGDPRMLLNMSGLWRRRSNSVTSFIRRCISNCSASSGMRGLKSLPMSIRHYGGCRVGHIPSVDEAKRRLEHQRRRRRAT